MGEKRGWLCPQCGPLLEPDGDGLCPACGATCCTVGDLLEWGFALRSTVRAEAFREAAAAVREFIPVSVPERSARMIEALAEREEGGGNG